MPSIGPKKTNIRTFDQIRFAQLQKKSSLPLPKMPKSTEKDAGLRGRVTKKREGKVMVYFKSGGIITRKETTSVDFDSMKMLEEVFNTPFAIEDASIVSVEPLSKKKAENIKNALDSVLQKELVALNETNEGFEARISHKDFLIAIKKNGIKRVYDEISRLEMVHKHGPGVLTFLKNALKFMGNEPTHPVFLKNDGSIEVEGGESLSYDQILELAQKQLFRNSFES